MPKKMGRKYSSLVRWRNRLSSNISQNQACRQTRKHSGRHTDKTLVEGLGEVLLTDDAVV